MSCKEGSRSVRGLWKTSSMGGSRLEVESIADLVVVVEANILSDLVGRRPRRFLALASSRTPYNLKRRGSSGPLSVGVVSLGSILKCGI